MNIKRTFTTLSALVLICLALNVSARCQKGGDSSAELPNTKDGLELSIEIDKSVYRRNENAELTVHLTNVGNSPITIYKELGWGGSSSFIYGIQDSKGRYLRQYFLDDHQPDFPFKKEDFIIIQPHDSISKHRLIDLEDAKPNGTYKLIVWYHSPVPQEFAPDGLTVWSREEGPLRATPVSFQIVKK